MKWSDQYAIGSSGTLVLYRLDPQIDSHAYALRCIVTDKPVRWIWDRKSAYTWLLREAGLESNAAWAALNHADLWAQRKSSLRGTYHRAVKAIFHKGRVAGQ